MNFYTTSSFRTAISKLTHKRKDGYFSVVEDICVDLSSKDDSSLRDSNDRIRQEENFRIIKLRVRNSYLNLPKSDAFRLIYWVSTKSDHLVLLTVYPKRGSLSANNLTQTEFKRLLVEMLQEKEGCILQRVDIMDNLKVLDDNCSW